MTSLFANLPFATDGIFKTLEKGSVSLDGPLLTELSKFVGALGILAGVIFLVVAIVKTRDKVRWFWMSGGAFVIGGMLMIAGVAQNIQKSTGDTYGEVFGNSKGNAIILHQSASIIFHHFLGL